MDDKVEVARLRGRCLMIQDKIIAIQQECEESACKVTHRITGHCTLSSLPGRRKCESYWS